MGTPHTVKTCADCKQTKPVDQFYPAKSGRCGRDNYCKECRRCRDRARVSQRSQVVEANKARDPFYYRRKKLMQLYGITQEQYMEIHKDQNGVCAICMLPETRMLYGSVSHLVVDHNHHTGNVRGLLCHSCNFKLGVIEDEQYCLRSRQYLRVTDNYEFMEDAKCAAR